MAKPQAHKQLRPRETGWRFWLICFSLLVGPCVYGSWGLFYNDVTRVAPVTMGAVGAMFGAGLVSGGVNRAIRDKLRRRKMAVRKRKLASGHPGASR